jgi:hypothetical protein
MTRGQGSGNVMKINDTRRLRLLEEKLRLDHIKEGASETRKIYKEYVDIFKLPGDPLTATTATEHVIPTSSVPKGRVITLKTIGCQKHSELK